MTRLLALVLLLSVPTFAFARTIAVKSGDHAGFSRLVLGGNANGAWVFGRVDGGYEFRPNDDTIVYDLTSVFELIKKTRISAVTDRGDGRLFVSSDCACHADAFNLPGGQVVLDIKDGPPPAPGSRFERRLDQPTEARVMVAPEQPHVASAAIETAPADRVSPLDSAGLPLVLPSVSRAPTAFIRPDIPPARPPVKERAAPLEASMPSAHTQADLDRGLRVAGARDAVLRQIARAAAQGLLDADLRPVGEPGEIGKSESDPNTPPIQTASVSEPESESRADEVRSHFVLETAVDRASARNTPVRRETDEGDPCIAPSVFDVSGWGPRDSAWQSLGAFRARLTGARDMVEPDGVTNLVRHYIFLSFGAEAKSLIQRYPEAVDNAALLAVMAEVVDSGATANGARLVDQMACDGATALWATLAQAKLERTQTINRSAVALAFGALPPHLREHLGPPLAEKFLDIGDGETADKIRGAITRATAGVAPNSAPLAARFDVERGDLDTARGRLDSAIAAGDAALPAALLQRAELAWADGEAPAPDQITLLESLAYERRGTSGARPFLMVAARANAATSDFAKAFAQLAEMNASERVDSKDVEAIRADLFRLLAQNGSDVTFLKYSITRLDDAASLPAPDRRRLAKRFLDLGFPDPARQVLDGHGALPDPQDRVLFARAALAENRSDVAVGYLAGIEEVEAQTLRAAALERASDHAAAARAYSALGDTGADIATSWRGGLWPALVDKADGPIQASARLMRDDSGEAPNTAGPPLAHARSLVDASRSTRAVLDDLLESLEGPTQPQ